MEKEKISVKKYDTNVLHEMMAQQQQAEIQNNTNNIFLCSQDIEAHLKLFLT